MSDCRPDAPLCAGLVAHLTAHHLNAAHRRPVRVDLNWYDMSVPLKQSGALGTKGTKPIR